MRKFILAVVVISIVFTLACNNNKAAETQKPSAATSAPATSPAASATTPPATTAPATPAAGGLKIEVKVDPAQPNPNKATKFSAKVTDADGKPVTGADVNVSLVMKEMDMGKNEFKLADKGAGSYEGEGKFTMAGEWNTVVTAKQGAKSGTQTVSVKSVMPKP